MPTAHEHFSEQFQKWEIRGRGWQVYEQPVSPEPPFVPFRFKAMQAVDNGVRPSFLGSIFNKLLVPPTPPVEPEEPEEEPEPNSLIREPLVEFQASLPDKLDLSRDIFDQFLSSLSLCREPMSFELIGIHQRITAQFAAAGSDASLLRRQLSAYFPEAAFVPQEGALEQAWNATEGSEVLAVEFGLGHEFMLPLASARVDPFIGIIGALSELQPGELGLFQVLFQPAHEPWPESIVRSVTRADGKAFFEDATELAKAAENKISRPLFAAVVRILIRIEDSDRLLQLAQDLAGSLRVFAQPGGNELIPLKNDDYPFAEHIYDVLKRQSRRSGMLLNSDELIGFVHLPTSAVRSPAFQRQTEKTKSAPTITSHGILLGENVHGGKTVEVRLSAEQRTRHVHLIGASGTGKSTLLFNLIRQDIENSQGIAVMDPHGDLVDKILGIIPPERIDDVVLVDPSDEQFSVGFNILSAHSELEKTLLASDLVAVFQRLSSSWGDQMNSVLQNAILAFLESDRHGTIADVRRFLIETPFRNEFLKSVKDSEVIYYWQKNFPLLSGNKSIGSILTRLDALLAKKPIRHMVSQPENRLDFTNIMDTGKIFLAKLPEGLLGRENSQLIGSLLVSKFQQIAMSRQSQTAAIRKDFWLYIDEFANFITPSMAEILSGARKYRLGLTLAHHEMHQLQRNPEVASAVMSHPYTRIVFRVGDDDAKKLADGFAFFEANNLRNLETGHAIARVERSDFDFNLTIPLPGPLDATEAAERRQEVITVSRKTYAAPRAEVEAMLLKQLERAVPTPIIKAKPVETVETPKVVEIPKIHPLPAEILKLAEVLPPIVPEKKASIQLADLGKGGAQHKAIQQRLKAEAEKSGFLATIEKEIPNGSVDLLVEKGEHVIAAEISVTTTIDHEVGNVLKCIQAGFAHIAVICQEETRLQKIEVAVITSLGQEVSKRVAYFQPDAFGAHLAVLGQERAETPLVTAFEKTSVRRGYKVTRTTGKLTTEEQQARENAVISQIATLMKQRLV